jgi:phosphatidylinositol 4-kinase
MKEDNNINDHYKEQLIKTDTNLERINGTNNNIIQENDQELEPIEEYEKRSCIGSCCFYMFCCCCCHSRIRTKDYFKKNWKNYLFKEGNDASDLPFNKLTNLFANGDDEAIEALGDFRVNPNLVSENKLRNDLEFYIPQLCTFLLFGDIKAIEEFFVFLCKVCNASFFFAHRVHWFLSAMINAAQEKKQDIINILKMVNTVFKSPSKKIKHKIENFYIANSDDFIKYIKTNNLYFLYDSNLINDNINIFDKINYNKLGGYQQELFNKYKKSRDIIIDYSNKEYEELKQAEEEKNKIKMRKSSKKELDPKIEDKKNITNSANVDINTEVSNVSHMNISILPNTSEYKFKSNEFLIDLSNFKLMNEDLTYEEDEDFNFDDDKKTTNQNDLKPSDLYSDKLTDNFININIGSTDINFISYHSTINFIEHLCDISNELPNHPIEEQMLFLYQKIRDINKQLPCNVYLPFLKDSTRNYLICHIPLEGARIFRTKTRCPLMLTFEMVRIDEINEAIKEEQENGLSINVERTKSISSISTKKDRDTFTTRTLLKDKIISEELNENEKVVYTGADYDLSKPVILNVAKKGGSKKNDNDSKKKNYKLKDIKEHELDTDFDLKRQNSKYEDSLENIRIKNIIKKFKQANAVDNDRTLMSKTIFEPKFKSNFLANSMNIPISTSSKLLADIPEKDDEISEEKKKMIDEEMKKEDLTPKNTKINMEALKNVFGETFSQKGKNIKNKSLFGKLNTHKIFRCIIKTHEDLRQEQFATQLINEFYQIYQLEHTNLWLNTYEIISTGNDSGLVEMVNDSLSLDALKQKLDRISLSDFYLHYFGNGNPNSHSYKTAMKNYIASLAGYSLVCYFLQIKDRHNGNILIDNRGHLIHIDFGFLLSNAPGKGLKFETAPFKLSKDMVDCLGGVNGKYFDEFKKLLRKGFTAINKHRDKIIILVEMMWCGHGRNLDCFEKGQEAINELKVRLNPKENMKKNDINRLVDDLINQSVDNWRTKWYDIFQYHAQGIFY